MARMALLRITLVAPIVCALFALPFVSEAQSNAQKPPKAVVAYAEGLERNCSKYIASGSIEPVPVEGRSGEFIRILRGPSGHSVFIVDGAQTACSDSFPFCGTGGCETAIFEMSRGVTKTLYRDQVLGWSLSPDGNVIRLDVHGSRCEGRSGPDRCIAGVDLRSGTVRTYPPIPPIAPALNSSSGEDNLNSNAPSIVVPPTDEQEAKPGYRFLNPSTAVEKIDSSGDSVSGMVAMAKPASTAETTPTPYGSDKIVGAPGSPTDSVEMAANSRAANPSFNCRRAKAADERAICRDPRLAQLDQAVSIAYGQAEQHYKDDAKEIARDTLKARHACGANRLCILDQQVNAIELFSGFESKVPVPPWVGGYRLKLFTESGKRPSQGLPGHVGECTITKIASISTRFGDELKFPVDEFDAGSAVTYANEGYQVSYSYIDALANSNIGDEVLVCLVSVPHDCPPGDDRGRFYSATNLRTKGSWLLPDAQHMCGGA